MPAYNFQCQFVKAILEGDKPHTIRRRRKRPTKVGDVIKMYTGLRTKKARLFAEAVCVKVEPIVIWVDGLLTTSLTSQALSKEKVKEIARRDGFETTKEFFDFFKRYGKDYLDDFEIIWWDVKTLTPTLSLQGEGEGVRNG